MITSTSIYSVLQVRVAEPDQVTEPHGVTEPVRVTETDRVTKPRRVTELVRVIEPDRVTELGRVDATDRVTEANLVTAAERASRLPIVDAGPFLAAVMRGEDGCRERLQLGRELKSACHDAGMFYLIGHRIEPKLIDQVLFESAKFFDCDDDQKFAISMKNSPHFRGFGRLKNSRDWREQIHIGVEAKVDDTDYPDAHYRSLEGPNQWPVSRTDEFRQTMLDYIEAIESLSKILLTIISEALDRPSDFFTSRMQTNPYLLLKTMSYFPQKSASGESNSQMGVTAHCDWSWLTFLAQDDVGGLEALNSNGEWMKVEPMKDALVVNTGELLELETGGYFRASPHRVINERIDRQRFSVAVFVNPDLDEIIMPMESFSPDDNNIVEHVHKVIEPGTTHGAFVFGDSEWKRKAEGLWCYKSECLGKV